MTWRRFLMRILFIGPLYGLLYTVLSLAQRFVLNIVKY